MIITSHGSGISAEFLSAYIKSLAVCSNLVEIAEPAAAQRSQIILVHTLILFFYSGFYPRGDNALSPGNSEIIVYVL